MPLPSVGAPLAAVIPQTTRPASGLTQADMISGAIKIISATTDGSNEYRLDTNTLPGGVLIQHSLASITTPTGAYSPVGGKLRTALAVTASGISMGYNRTSDGAFVVTMNLDGSTGNMALTGTLQAGSIIADSVSLSGGSTLGTIRSDTASALSIAGTANSTANAALAALSDKLDKSGSDILSGAVEVQSSGGFKVGTITWNSSGQLTGGTGVAFTSNGIVGASGGSAKFTLEVNGDATFSGDITGATGTFAGAVRAGTAGGQRVSLNESSSNRLRVYDSTNSLVVELGNDGGDSGGTGASAALYMVPKTISASGSDWSTGAFISMPNFGSNSRINGMVAKVADSTLSGSLCIGYTQSTGSFRRKYGLGGAVVRSGVTYESYLSLDAADSLNFGAAGYFTKTGGMYVKLCDSVGYSMDIDGGWIRYHGVDITYPDGDSSKVLCADGVWRAGSGVTSFEGRTGSISLESGDVTGALGYTPLSSVSSSDITSALGVSYADVIYFISDNGPTVTLGRVGGGTATFAKA